MEYHKSFFKILTIFVFLKRFSGENLLNAHQYTMNKHELELLGSELEIGQ